MKKGTVTFYKKPKIMKIKLAKFSLGFLKNTGVVYTQEDIVLVDYKCSLILNLGIFSLCWVDIETEFNIPLVVV